MAHHINHRIPGSQQGGGSGSRGLRVAASALLSAGLLLLSPTTPAAYATSRFDLLGLQVFAKQTIQAERSDYEGPAAAGDAVDLTDFEVDGDVTAGQRLAFRRGQVRGVVRAPDTRLSDVFSSGKGPVTDQSLEMAALKLDLLSARLAALPATTTVAVVTAPDGKTEVQARAQRDLDVVDLSGEALMAAGEDRTRLVLKGDAGSRMVVRIHGRSIRMQHLGFVLQGGLGPDGIVFLFPEAGDLEIASSGGARGAAGEDWNWPGSVLAPYALLRFGATTITGQVFARAIAAIPGLPSGQVNRFPPSPGGGFTPSRLLQSIDNDHFVDLLPADQAYGPPVGAVAPARCRIVCPYHAQAGQ